MPSKEKIVPAPIISLDSETHVIHDAAREDDGYGNPIPPAIFIETRRLVERWDWELIRWSESRWT